MLISFAPRKQWIADMATITQTQTVEEFMPTRQFKQIMSPKLKVLKPKSKQESTPQALGCPPDCPCKEKPTKSKPMALFFNAIGILIALIATYMIVTTDSNIYLIFWVVYSILRRLTKSRSHAKSD